VRRADNLPPSCVVDKKSGNFNFLEPSGLLRTCNGTPLPFTCFDSSLGHHQVVSLYRRKYTIVSYRTLYSFLDKDLRPDDGLVKSQNM